MSRQDIGNYLGLAIETVNRLIARQTPAMNLQFLFDSVRIAYCLLH
jgi:hypothetical protein